MAAPEYRFVTQRRLGPPPGSAALLVVGAGLVLGAAAFAGLRVLHRLRRRRRWL